MKKTDWDPCGDIRSHSFGETFFWRLDKNIFRKTFWAFLPDQDYDARQEISVMDWYKILLQVCNTWLRQWWIKSSRGYGETFFGFDENQ